MLKPLLLTLSMGLFASSFPAAANWQATTDFQALEQKVDTLRAEQGIALASSLSNSQGTPWQYTKGSGWADNDNQIDADSRFRAGSVTKVFIAIAALKLVEQGKLKLDDPVKKYLPNVEIDNPWSDTDPVRVSDLLSHTAGFRDSDVTEIYTPTELATAPLQEVIAQYKLQVRWQPGSRQAYSNFGFLLAGHLIEQVAGESFETLLANTILKPLNMNNSSFSQDTAQLSTLITGHGSALTGGQDVVPAMPISVRPAGSLITTLNDLTRFTRMLLNDGELDGVRIISPQSIYLMQTTAMDKNSVVHQAGYGLGLYPVNRGSGRYFCHSGGIDGFLSNICFSKEQDIAFVALSNSMTLSGNKVFDESLSYLVEDALPEINALDFDISPWLGFYRPESARQQSMAAMDRLFKGSEITFEADRLMIKPIFGTPDEYVYVSNQGFRPVDKQAVSLTLAFNSQGEAVVQETWDTYLPGTNWYAPLVNYVFLFFAASWLLTCLGAVLMLLYVLVRKCLTKSINTIPKLHLSLLLLPIVMFGLYLSFAQLALWELTHITAPAFAMWLFSCSWPFAIVYSSWLIWVNRSQLTLKRSKIFWSLALVSQWVIGAYLVYFGTYNITLWS